ncbi:MULTISPECIES: tryptophan synthase subunit alpha [unclassified Rhizobium]|uniref:tryptophan synthase subunit alpha n=1 Tax=unclassified Rhizobium TaxID=2613769 RepID=UPI003809A01D
MTQNRIDLMFARLKAERRSAFVTFTVACDPSFDESLERMRLLAENGIDLLEIGHPFSDPILDGATIQRANRRALAAGGSLPRTLDLCAAFRLDNDETPIILMGYANPIRTMGYDVFAARAAAAGVDGLIVADLPLREADALLKHLSKHGLVMIPLAAPSLPADDFVSDHGGVGGFLYCIPVVGPTGGPSASIDVIAGAVERCRSVSDMPIMVGFGIKTPEMAAAVAKVADGVIVATALIERFETMLQDCTGEAFNSTAAQLVAEYRHAIDSRA